MEAKNRLLIAGGLFLLLIIVYIISSSGHTEEAKEEHSLTTTPKTIQSQTVVMNDSNLTSAGSAKTISDLLSSFFTISIAILILTTVFGKRGFD